MDPSQLWHFLPRGYLASIAIETAVLMIGLSRSHSLARRLFAGVWLTACTYPIVILVLPILMNPDASPARHTAYLAVAETFAPLAECALFAAAYHRPGDPSRPAKIRDLIVIILANLASFGFGELAEMMHWHWG